LNDFLMSILQIGRTYGAERRRGPTKGDATPDRLKAGLRTKLSTTRFWLSFVGSNTLLNPERGVNGYRRIASMTEDDKFLAEFEACRWPREEWHHRQHIKVAYLYLRRYPFDEAITRARERIKAHNAAHCVPEGPNEGYHETVTQAWMRLVYLTLCEYGPAETADKFLDQHPQLGANKVLRLFYSRELVTSPRAKVEFVEPDLAPLPRSNKSGHKHEN
jgi:hypothetical protein